MINAHPDHDRDLGLPIQLVLKMIPRLQTHQPFIGQSKKMDRTEAAGEILHNFPPPSCLFLSFPSSFSLACSLHLAHAITHNLLGLLLTFDTVVFTTQHPLGLLPCSPYYPDSFGATPHTQCPTLCFREHVLKSLGARDRKAGPGTNLLCSLIASPRVKVPSK